MLEKSYSFFLVDRRVETVLVAVATGSNSDAIDVLRNLVTAHGFPSVRDGFLGGRGLLDACLVDRDSLALG